MTEREPASLPSAPFHEATHLLRRLKERNEEMERAHAHSLDVNPVDYRVMGMLLTRGSSTAGEIGLLLGYSPSATSNVVDRLERAGHVERVRDPADRRRVVVAATPASRAQALAGLIPMIESVDAAIRGMSDEEQAAVVAFLTRAIEATNRFVADLERG